MRLFWRPQRRLLPANTDARRFQVREQTMNAPSDGRVVYLCRITADDRIEFVNDAWIRFAEENETPALPQTVMGDSLWQHISGPEVIQLFRQLVAKVRETHTEVSIPFRCDSPTCRRFMRMRIVPLHQRRIEFCTWIEREEPFAQPVRLLDPAVPRDGNALLRMCAWCKKIHVAAAWLEIEEAIGQLQLFDSRTLPALTHGMCDRCFQMMTTGLGTWTPPPG